MSLESKRRTGRLAVPRQVVPGPRPQAYPYRATGSHGASYRRAARAAAVPRPRARRPRRGGSESVRRLPVSHRLSPGRGPRCLGSTWRKSVAKRPGCAFLFVRADVAAARLRLYLVRQCSFDSMIEPLSSLNLNLKMARRVTGRQGLARTQR